MVRKPTRPRDPNQLAKLITELATSAPDTPLVTSDGRDLAATIMGRRGGLKGGRARAQSLTPEARQKIARKAAEARWGKKA